MEEEKRMISVIFDVCFFFSSGGSVLSSSVYASPVPFSPNIWSFKWREWWYVCPF